MPHAAGAKLSPFRRNRLGIGWVPQEREVFPTLSVAENLDVVYRGGPWTRAALYDLFPRLAERRSHYARQLSGGEQQMLVIARALATNPSLLLLDEPVEGLAPLIVQEMIAAIHKMRRESAMSIIMVEQKHDIALAHSDRCLVIDHGAIVHTSASAELLADHALLDRLIGVAPVKGQPVSSADSLSAVAPWRVVNIAGGRPVELMRFVTAIEAAMGREAKKELLPMQPGDVTETAADVALLRALVGEVPTTEVEVGVRAFCDWFKGWRG